MSLEVVWGAQALAALYRIHWQTGAVIDAAVIRFAASPFTERSALPVRCRLRAAGHDVALVVDAEAGEVRVLGLYRAR